MALPEHVASAKLVTIRCLKRQRAIAYQRGHIDDALALGERLKRLGVRENGLQREVAECLRIQGGAGDE